MKKLTKEEELFWEKLPVIPGNPKFKPNFFRQLFCSHCFDNFQHKNGWASFLMCAKCGKQIQKFKN